MGTYSEYKNGKYDNDSAIIMKFNGELGRENGEAGMSYRVYGEDMTVYWGDAELMSGKVVNGVIKISILGDGDYYCKSGKIPESFN